MTLIELTATSDDKKPWSIFINPNHMIWAEQRPGEKYVTVRCDTGGMFYVSQSADEIKKKFEESMK